MTPLQMMVLNELHGAWKVILFAILFVLYSDTRASANGKRCRTCGLAFNMSLWIKMPLKGGLFVPNASNMSENAWRTCPL